MRRPWEWTKLLSFRYPPSIEMSLRTVMLPDRPLTRYEYFEEMAFVKERMRNHGRVPRVQNRSEPR